MRYTSLGFARLGEPDDLGAPLPRGFAREAMNNTVLRKPLSRAAAAAAVSSDDEATASTVMESQMEGPGVAVGPLLGAIGVQARRVHCWFWSFLVPHARVRRVVSSYPSRRCQTPVVPCARVRAGFLPAHVRARSPSSPRCFSFAGRVLRRRGARHLGTARAVRRRRRRRALLGAEHCGGGRCELGRRARGRGRRGGHIAPARARRRARVR